MQRYCLASVGIPIAKMRRPSYLDITNTTPGKVFILKWVEVPVWWSYMYLHHGISYSSKTVLILNWTGSSSHIYHHNVMLFLCHDMYIIHIWTCLYLLLQQKYGAVSMVTHSVFLSVLLAFIVYWGNKRNCRKNYGIVHEIGWTHFTEIAYELMDWFHLFMA